MNDDESMLKPLHKPVLLNAFLKTAMPDSGKVFADATFGMGGHSKALLESFPNIEKIIGIDKDREILDISARYFVEPRIIRVHAKASELPTVLAQLNMKKLDGVLLDLGVSSYQLDSPERGFSFSHSGPLDMRMDRSQELNALTLVNESTQAELTAIFRNYGEEKFAARIAKAIVDYRKNDPIRETCILSNIAASVIPKQVIRAMKINPATRIFQAIRIAVNNELDELRFALNAALQCLGIGGRISVISFHSLEDRIVKEFFNGKQRGCTCPPFFPVCTCGQKPQVKVLTPKPICADPEEISQNPRSRSAKLRVAVKISDRRD